jgi:hypothetical protein
MTLGEGIVHRLRRPGRAAATVRPPGDLGARSVRFARALTPRPLRTAAATGTGPVPGSTLAAAIRTEVPVHRLSPVQAAGVMAVAPKLVVPNLFAPQPQP